MEIIRENKLDVCMESGVCVDVWVRYCIGSHISAKEYFDNFYQSDKNFYKYSFFCFENYNIIFCNQSLNIDICNWLLNNVHFESKKK